jgi:hypothetical protein
LSTEKALSPRAAAEAVNAPEISRPNAVRELMRLFVKAQKTQRLYEGNNAVSARLENELFARLTEFLETEGDIQLVVLEFHLKFEEEVVYDNPDRNHSLAFLLYRDGLRRLSFHAGLELAELQAFLTCLNRVAVLANEQDDLVTLFWDQDFHAIRYFAIEELSNQTAYPRLEEQLASGELECEGGIAGERVGLDLEQPVSTVPVEACRLADAEIEALRAELASELAMPFQHVVAELAIELTLLDDDEQQRLDLVRHLVAISDRLIVDGALGELAAMEEHLDGLATMVFGNEERVQRLAGALLAHLSERERVEAFLAKVDEHNAPKPEVLTAYLARRGSSCTEWLITWMGRLSSSAYRRAVTNALLVSDEGGLGTLAANLPLEAPSATPRDQLEHRQFVRELLYALSHHPAERAIPLLERLLEASDLETRRESFVALTRYPDERVDELSLARLEDRDSEIRATALDTLVRRGKKDLGQRALAQALRAPELDVQSLNEKRRLFAAVAKLCGDSALEQLSQQLTGKEDRWFTSKKDEERAEAVAHGIRMIGSERAKDILRHLSKEGARFVRAACAKELGQ